MASRCAKARRLLSDQCTSRSTLPRVDLSSKTATQQIQQACSNDGPGFFYLTMSPHENDIASLVLRLSRDFFALDGEIKQALKNDERDYFRYKGKRVPSSGPGYRPVAGDVNFSRDFRESFNVGFDTTGHPSPPYGNTRWPLEEQVPGFFAACETYSQLLLQKSYELRQCIAEALGEKREFFNAPGLFDSAPWLLGFVHYLPCQSDVSQGRYGIAPHQDDGIFTLLHTDGSPGLQICPSWNGSVFHRDAAMHDSSLEWVDVPYLPGHWIVNLGTMLQRWTNGKFKATLHRVVLTAPASDRFSMPFFYEANLDAPVECLPSCKNFDESSSPPPPPTTPGALLLEMAARDGIGLISEESVRDPESV